MIGSKRQETEFLSSLEDRERVCFLCGREVEIGKDFGFAIEDRGILHEECREIVQGLEMVEEGWRKIAKGLAKRPWLNEGEGGKK